MRPVLSLAVLVALASPALSQSPVALRNDQVPGILQGLIMLGGDHDRVVKDADGKETIAKVPYQFGADMVWAMANDIAVLRNSDKLTNDAFNILVHKYAQGHKNDKGLEEVPADKVEAFLADKAQLGAQPLQGAIIPLKKSYFNIGDKPEQNQISTNTISLIVPILDQ